MKNYFLICVALLFTIVDLFSQVIPPPPSGPGGPPPPPFPIDSSLAVVFIAALILGFYLVSKRKHITQK